MDVLFRSAFGNHMDQFLSSSLAQLVFFFAFNHGPWIEPNPLSKTEYTGNLFSNGRLNLILSLTQPSEDLWQSSSVARICIGAA